MHETPLVSIACPTFNNEKYIAQAIESFLSQQTDFPFEIIIHDDASTDRTAEIISAYAGRYPEKIIPIFQTKNQFSQGNQPLSAYIYPKARGKYIALCDGDDFWIDPLKLRKQVDFLEKNPEFGLVHTDNSNLWESSGKMLRSHKFDYYPNPPSGNIFEAMLIKNFISTLTVMVNAGLIREVVSHLKSWIDPRLYFDYSVWLEISTRTQIKYLNEITAVYRISGCSLSHSASGPKKVAWSQQIFDTKMAFIGQYAVDPQIEHTVSQQHLTDMLKKKIYGRLPPGISAELVSIRPATLENQILSKICRFPRALGFYYFLFAPKILFNRLLKFYQDRKNSSYFATKNDPCANAN
jgi:glycosyltransferase involved in cell wall biosynthesis